MTSCHRVFGHPVCVASSASIFVHC